MWQKEQIYFEADEAEASGASVAQTSQVLQGALAIQTFVFFFLKRTPQVT